MKQVFAIVKLGSPTSYFVEELLQFGRTDNLFCFEIEQAHHYDTYGQAEGQIAEFLKEYHPLRNEMFQIDKVFKAA